MNIGAVADIPKRRISATSSSWKFLQMIEPALGRSRYCRCRGRYPIAGRRDFNSVDEFRMPIVETALWPSVIGGGSLKSGFGRRDSNAGLISGSETAEFLEPAAVYRIQPAKWREKHDAFSTTAAKRISRAMIAFRSPKLVAIVRGTAVESIVR